VPIEWTKPEFREVSVCGECTAYAGADDLASRGSATAQAVANPPEELGTSVLVITPDGIQEPV
jgi:hypothetical protein